MESHNAKCVFIRPSGEGIAVLLHSGFFELLCPSERAPATLLKRDVSAKVPQAFVRGGGVYGHFCGAFC